MTTERDRQYEAALERMQRDDVSFVNRFFYECEDGYEFSAIAATESGASRVLQAERPGVLAKYLVTTCVAPSSKDSGSGEETKTLRGRTGRVIGQYHKTKGGFWRNSSYITGIGSGPFRTSTEAINDLVAAEQRMLLEQADRIGSPSLREQVLTDCSVVSS